MIAGEQEVIGTRAGKPEPIEPYVFSGCRVIHPFEEVNDHVIHGEELVLVSFPYVDEASRRAGFDDSLRNRHGASWSRISVRRIVVTEGAEGASPGPKPSTSKALVKCRTGSAGRPSTKPLYIPTFRRRVANDEFHDTLREEATYLADRLRMEHSDRALPTVKTIENEIRTEFNTAKTERSQRNREP